MSESPKSRNRDDSPTRKITRILPKPDPRAFQNRKTRITREPMRQETPFLKAKRRVRLLPHRKDATLKASPIRDLLEATRDRSPVPFVNNPAQRSLPFDSVN